ncbi:hypothetical protein [Pseudomonas monteilii]|uniref:hypothetical protein n=1 Tax=Pseudomonas monteilii TaxID=76759 RepID=UPI0019104028|nr:hypothetical protein [Pseudomonas monteilii]
MEKLGWRDRRISPDSGSLFQTFLRFLDFRSRLLFMMVLLCLAGAFYVSSLKLVGAYAV